MQDINNKLEQPIRRAELLGLSTTDIHVVNLGSEDEGYVTVVYAKTEAIQNIVDRGAIQQIKVGINLPDKSKVTKYMYVLAHSRYINGVIGKPTITEATQMVNNYINFAEVRLVKWKGKHDKEFI